MPEPAPALDHVEMVDLRLRDIIPILKRPGRPLDKRRLESNISEVGLIEPLLVHPFKGQFFLLDGYRRMQLFLDKGVDSVPCILIPVLDAYTPNRNVNFISLAHRWKMLKAALEVVDEGRLKNSLAITVFRTEFSVKEKSLLAQEVISAVAEDLISKSAAQRLVHVSNDRQREILALIRHSGDKSPAFIKAQVTITPPEQRVLAGKTNPWNRTAEVKKNLIDRLTEAERNADFFEGIYRRYARDLTVLAIYIRDMVNRDDVRNHLAKHFPDEVKLFQQIVQQAGMDN